MSRTRVATWRSLLAVAVLFLCSGCAATTSQTPLPQPGAAAGRTTTARAEDCFPFERLPQRLQGRASDLLLNALDGEALYTIAADIKPMSSGFYSTQVTVANPELREVDEIRQILRMWTCGDEIDAIVHPFSAVYEGKRPLDAAVFNRPALQRMMARQQAFFAPYGLSPSADPAVALMAIEYDTTTARLRGYGYFFGYPDYAVDFFVSAADEQKATDTHVPRDFISLPTVRGERRFVYAAPKGHSLNAEDLALRSATEKVFADYSARRARHITKDSSAGVLALVREWFDDGRGDVRPSNASTCASTPAARSRDALPIEGHSKMRSCTESFMMAPALASVSGNENIVPWPTVLVTFRAAP
jgi:hypothetical protein